MENKDILIQGYWIEFVKKIAELENVSDFDAKVFKDKMLDAVNILDKIIELEDK